MEASRRYMSSLESMIMNENETTAEQAYMEQQGIVQKYEQEEQADQDHDNDLFIPL
ncbi:hypothetical protein TVAG_591170 [Trichomonas vaginalis G3]|uniref:Uncharacterized protein n=1 Tax=Trichomonas vaginalis (strain ATCC PRA-98 / G3) TaxID=412133 RepID=A2GTV6_TRIV3|nr:hypothetical protein TVAGG3_0099630 [Trichomonas vaginalis G3]EAX79411.1 hypothetical protein TVAG_591170 [Trichomonas vaginalis G3]KAI5544305.1 hypothetical protein TVAGG3_0099630 [Trichomonas vaginalis G3]|eukprot:XP_001292341.1 hypothetical protein [Trichomonas vaginalis G3]